MSTFTGKFYVVTAHSIFQVTIFDLIRSPQVMKVRLRPSGKDLLVPVGGVLQGGFYVAITSEGIFKYRMVKHQRAPLHELPKRIEQLSRKGRAMRAFPPVGLFLEREMADQCFESESTIVFDPQWEACTRKVLRAIGHQHPLVTISTETAFAVPRHLCEDVK